MHFHTYSSSLPMFASFHNISQSGAHFARCSSDRRIVERLRQAQRPSPPRPAPGGAPSARPAAPAGQEERRKSSLWASQFSFRFFVLPLVRMERLQEASRRLREASGRLREASEASGRPPGPGRLREAPGRLREPPGGVWKPPGGLWEACCYFRKP